MLYRELTESVIGAAMLVLKTLKHGLNEKDYENAMVIELKKRGHTIDQQRRFDVLYDKQLVDTLVSDLLVDGLVVVDPKVVNAFTETHLAQMMGYLIHGGEVSPNSNWSVTRRWMERLHFLPLSMSLNLSPGERRQRSSSSLNCANAALRCRITTAWLVVMEKPEPGVSCNGYPRLWKIALP